MTLGERLQALAPWDTCSEEDLFRFDEELYLSIRGQVHLPMGVLVTSHEEVAEAWVMEPDRPLDERSWMVFADGRLLDGTGAPLEPATQARVEQAVGRVLDHFEDRPTPGLEFPLWFNC